jgi:flavin-binding protein dodecin
VLTEMRDEQLGSALGRVQKSIRNLDVAAVSEVVTAVEDRLSD